MSNNSSSTSVGEPTWEIALLFPDQGMWRESDYLELNTNRLVEFVDGRMFRAGETFSSQLLPGLTVNVDDVFSAGRET